MKLGKSNLLAMTAFSLLSSLAIAGSKGLEVTYGPEDALDGDVVTENGQLFKEILPGREIYNLHEANHDYTPIIRSLLPPYYDLPDENDIEDSVITQSEMAIINPVPGEYVRITEGKRHGFSEMTIAMTSTEPGSGAPLHTHDVEVSHTVNTRQLVRYIIGDERFVVRGPFVINIPALTPHAFANLSNRTLAIVLSFPTNDWQVDFLDHPNVEEFFTAPVTRDERKIRN